MESKKGSLQVTVPRTHFVSDAAIVLFLTVLIGAFVVEIASRPPSGDAASASRAASYSITLG